MGTRISQSRNRTSGLSTLNKAVFPVSLNQVGTVTMQVDFEDEAEEDEPEEDESEEDDEEDEEDDEDDEEEEEEEEDDSKHRRQ